MRVLRTVLAVGFAMLVSAGLSVSVARAAIDPPVNYYVSDEMVDGYCKVHGHRQMVVVAKNAYGYRCETASGAHIGVNMDAVCTENNKPASPIVAWFNEREFFSGPAYVWMCAHLQHGTKSLGGLNLEQFCVYFNLGDYVVLAGETVADWQCRWRDHPELDNDIDLDSACQHFYSPGSNDYAIPRFNFWDPYSVRCYR